MFETFSALYCVTVHSFVLSLLEQHRTTTQKNVLTNCTPLSHKMPTFWFHSLMFSRCSVFISKRFIHFRLIATKRKMYQLWLVMINAGAASNICFLLFWWMIYNFGVRVSMNWKFGYSISFANWFQCRRLFQLTSITKCIFHQILHGDLCLCSIISTAQWIIARAWIKTLSWSNSIETTWVYDSLMRSYTLRRNP